MELIVCAISMLELEELEDTAELQSEQVFATAACHQLQQS